MSISKVLSQWVGDKVTYSCSGQLKIRFVEESENPTAWMRDYLTSMLSNFLLDFLNRFPGNGLRMIYILYYINRSRLPDGVWHKSHYFCILWILFINTFCIHGPHPFGIRDLVVSPVWRRFWKWKCKQGKESSTAGQGYLECLSPAGQVSSFEERKAT